MCEHCGCRLVEPIAELMDEHTALLDEATFVRKALADGDPVRAMGMLHRDLDTMRADLDTEAADFAPRVTELLGFLDLHVERENLGIFPVSVVTLGLEGSDLVARAHDETPTFLTDAPRP